MAPQPPFGFAQRLNKAPSHQHVWGLLNREKAMSSRVVVQKRRSTLTIALPALFAWSVHFQVGAKNVRTALVQKGGWIHPSVIAVLDCAGALPTWPIHSRNTTTRKSIDPSKSENKNPALYFYQTTNPLLPPLKLYFLSKGASSLPTSTLHNCQSDPDEALTPNVPSMVREV